MFVFPTRYHCLFFPREFKKLGLDRVGITSWGPPQLSETPLQLKGAAFVTGSDTGEQQTCVSDRELTLGAHHLESDFRDT